MVQYKCNICNKIFDRKSNYNNHTNRKNKCILKVSPEYPTNISQKDSNVANRKNNVSEQVSKENKSDIVCKYCSKIFTFKNNLYRHLAQTCKIKQQRDNEKEDIFKCLLEEMKEIKEENKIIREQNKELQQELKKINNRKIKNINNINNKTNTKNNTKNNMVNNGSIVSGNTFMLIGYGKEDMTKIDKDDIIRSLKGFNTPLKLTETVHFNSKYPEYHNVYISNMKDKYAMIYGGNKWSLTTKTELIDKLYDNKKSYIEDNLEEFCETLSRSQRKSLDRWLNIDDEDPKVKAIKEDIKLLLYNKRDMPMQTKGTEITEN